MDPYRIGYQTLNGYWKRRGWPDTEDWSHANGLEYVEKTNSILINFRIQSAIFNISRQTGEIIWIAGEPSGWSAGASKGFRATL